MTATKRAKVICGETIAQTIRSELAEEVRLLSLNYGKVPGLAVVVMGDSLESQNYVIMKQKACDEVGIKCFIIDLPEQISETTLIAKVHELNANSEVHGILIQLPVPKHMNEERVLSKVSIEKDVDGFHPLNIGKLAMKGTEPLFLPCTPKGCLELLSRSGIVMKGKKAVVVSHRDVGANDRSTRSSNNGIASAYPFYKVDPSLVGLAVSLLLLKNDAHISIVHCRTPETESIIREADIVIAAAGQIMMVKGDWIKPGATVIDLGTTAVDDQSMELGYRLVGDVDFDEVSKVAGWITPVPGGAGPMTTAMLLRNTVDGAKRVIVPSSLNHSQ